MNANFNSIKIGFLLFLSIINFNLIKSTVINYNDLNENCVKSFIKENRTHEINKCILQDHVILDFECKIILLREKEKLIKAIDSIFSLRGLKNDTITYVEFEWEAKHGDEKIIRNKNNSRNISLDYTNIERLLDAKLTLKEIDYEISYEICTRIEGLVNKICCEVELKEAEEESNIFLSLLVLGVVVLFLVIIMLVFWLCPPTEYHSLDEMLEQLPTSHVEALKTLVTEADMEEMDDGVQDHDFDLPKSLKSKKVRINTAGTEIDNLAFEDDENDEDIDHQLMIQAQKIRRMSMMPHGPIGDTTVKKKGGVRFKDVESNEEVHMNDMDNLKIKLFNESNRRASIKPFKKTFQLDISSDSDN
jgi:hypothetical protein